MFFWIKQFKMLPICSSTWLSYCWKLCEYSRTMADTMQWGLRNRIAAALLYDIKRFCLTKMHLQIDKQYSFWKIFIVVIYMRMLYDALKEILSWDIFIRLHFHHFSFSPNFGSIYFLTRTQFSFLNVNVDWEHDNVHSWTTSQANRKDKIHETSTRWLIYDLINVGFSFSLKYGSSKGMIRRIIFGNIKRKIKGVSSFTTKLLSQSNFFKV